MVEFSDSFSVFAAKKKEKHFSLNLAVYLKVVALNFCMHFMWGIARCVW